MAKSIAASLLLGAAAVMAGLLLYILATSPDQPVSSLVLDAAAAQVEVGEGSRGRGAQLVLSDSGVGVIKWPVPGATADNFSYLRLRFEGSHPSGRLSVFWKSAATGARLHSYRATDSLAQLEWVPLQSLEKWRGAITELGLVIYGKPQERVTVGSLALLPDTVFTRLKVMFAHWLTPASWNHSSINFYSGVRYVNTLIPPPVPVVALWFGCSLMFYQLFWRRNSGLNWKVVACIFLVCWISLDLMWQRKLLLQLRETHKAFAGKSSVEKRSVGMDAALFNFIGEAKELMPIDASRLFVLSSDDYRGMRGAYYAYPHNVYWRRKSRGLAEQNAIRSDDYILLLPPTSLSYNSAEQTLESPGAKPIAVQLLISRQAGALFRAL